MSFDFTTFQGAANCIDSLDIPRLAHRIGVGEDEIHAFAEVEAANSGFDSQGRPRMLFEPHVFYRNLRAGERDQAVTQGLAYKKWRPGSYPRDSYPRLAEALTINQSAALKAASWGRLQVLGENYAMCGYVSPEQMVSEMMHDEENHLEAGINYILAAGIDDDLRSLAGLTQPTTPADCAPIVRVWNGAGYAKGGYHIKFAKAHNKWRNTVDTGWSPDVPDSVEPGIENGNALKQVQLRLRGLGYHEVGRADGVWGTKSRAGVLAFRADTGLPIYAGVDDELLAALMMAPPREVGEARATDTVKNLQKTSRTISDAADAKTAGKVTMGAGGLLGVGEIIKQLNEHAGIFQNFAAKLAPIQEFALDNLPLLLLGVGILVVWKSGLIQKWRVSDEREGKHAGFAN